MMLGDLLLALVGVASTLVSAAPNEVKRAGRACNGHPELCNRSYGNVTFMGAHDSYTGTSDFLNLSRDQAVQVPQQLDLGVRLLQAQAHMDDGVVHFCHTSCVLFDGGTVLDYLTTVKTWLQSHPNEVLTLLFTNPESLSLEDVWDPVFRQSGIADMAYVPPHTPMRRTEWPTLGELIDSGKRVIVFMDSGPNNDGSVPYLLYEFSMIWETPWGITDSSFPCKVNRIDSTLPGDDLMYMINHMLYVDVAWSVLVSDPVQASTTNGVDSIMKGVNNCRPYASGRPPNFVLLDFVDSGDPMQAVDELNGFSS